MLTHEHVELPTVPGGGGGGGGGGGEGGGGGVRQMLGRKGEVWIAESGSDRIRVIHYTLEGGRK